MIYQAVLAMLAVMPADSSFEVFQLDIKSDKGFIKDSEWGRFRFRHDGFPTVMYLNAVIDGAWVISNQPIFSVEGVGAAQSVDVQFNLMSPRGVDRTSVMFGGSLTPTPIGAPPSMTGPLPVFEDIEIIYSGIKGGGTEPEFAPPPLPPPPPPPGEDDKTNEDFPNQEAGKNECVPAAVSNSLNFLAASNGIGAMDPAMISIEALKPWLGWTAGGCGFSWWQGKDNYMKRRKFPIKTRKIDGDGLDDVYDVMPGADVEIILSGTGGGMAHMVAVTGIQPNGYGGYSVQVAHDRNQESKTDGTEGTDTLETDAEGKVVKGPWWAVGRKILQTVIETYEPPKKIGAGG
ncbi:MAG: hypothetical protein HONBIEJF_00675 [Fimbriimonadaceae bacterium]|nr:hypothetical protein [Fimbriimonadaceae bacterium]